MVEEEEPRPHAMTPLLTIGITEEGTKMIEDETYSGSQIMPSMVHDDTINQQNVSAESNMKAVIAHDTNVTFKIDTVYDSLDNLKSLTEAFAKEHNFEVVFGGKKFIVIGVTQVTMTEIGIERDLG